MFLSADRDRRCFWGPKMYSREGIFYDTKLLFYVISRKVYDYCIILAIDLHNLYRTTMFAPECMFCVERNRHLGE